MQAMLFLAEQLMGISRPLLLPLVKSWMGAIEARDVESGSVEDGLRLGCAFGMSTRYLSQDSRVSVSDARRRHPPL